MCCRFWWEFRGFLWFCGNFEFSLFLGDFCGILAILGGFRVNFEVFGVGIILFSGGF